MSFVLFVVVGQLAAAPADAVIRIASHGCSGQVIYTAQDYSLILTCAHAFTTQADRVRRLKLDIPMRGRPPEPRGRARVLAVRLDEERGVDCCLILLPAGPLPYVVPVAPAGYQPRRQVLSVGYDRMEAVVKVPSSLLGTDRVTYTRERPIPGRSGGALISGDYLIGTVIGYELRPNGRGLYVSHRTILQFLEANVRGQGSGVRGQESGVRGQESDLWGAPPGLFVAGPVGGCGPGG